MGSLEERWEEIDAREEMWMWILRRVVLALSACISVLGAFWVLVTIKAETSLINTLFLKTSHSDGPCRLKHSKINLWPYFESFKPFEGFKIPPK